MVYNNIVLYCILLYCTQLHCVTLPCTASNCIVSYCIVFHCTHVWYGSWRILTLLLNTLRYTALRYTQIAFVPRTSAIQSAYRKHEHEERSLRIRKFFVLAEICASDQLSMAVHAYPWTCVCREVYVCAGPYPVFLSSSYRLYESISKTRHWWLRYTNWFNSLTTLLSSNLGREEEVR